MNDTIISSDNNALKGRSVLVTGGSGFIGTHLISALGRLGAQIRNLDASEPGLREQKEFWVRGNLLNSDDVSKIVKEFQPDIVFNLAAETDIGKGEAAFLVNTKGVQVLLDVCSDASVKPQVVHFSTQFVVEAGYNPDSDEDMKPYTAYGESKAISERIVRQYEGRLRWTIVRPTLVWGPYHSAMSSTTLTYIKKRWYLMPRGKAAIRSYGYVSNVVEQTLNIAMVKPANVDGEVFYVGDAPVSSPDWLDGFSIALTGKPTRRFPYSILWLLSLGGEILARIGRPSPINFGRLERMSCDHLVPMEKTFEILGQGQTSFAEGVDETVKWLKGTV